MQRCHTAFPVVDKIVVFGGGLPVSDQLAVFDTVSNVWMPPPREEACEGISKPTARLNSASVVCGGSVFIFGGWNGDPIGECVFVTFSKLGVAMVVVVPLR
jgi:Kelch motif